MTYAERDKLGKKREKRARIFIRAFGFIVVKMGYEDVIPKAILKRIRWINNNRLISFIRHMPDIVAFHKNGREAFRAEIKGLENHRGDKSLYFTIEVASLKVCKSIMKKKKKKRILIIFEDGPNNFFAEWANEIDIHRRSTRKEERASTGSGRPWYYIEKEGLQPLSQKLKEILKENTTRRKQEILQQKEKKRHV